MSDEAPVSRPSPRAPAARAARPGAKASPAERLDAAFPGRFPFYHLGEVVSAPAPIPARTPSPDPAAGAADALLLVDDDALVFGYALAGEVAGTVLVAVDRGLDESTYSELGNIVASRVADALGAGGKLVLPGPPQVLDAAAALRIAGAPRATVARREYLHVNRGAAIRVAALLVLAEPASGEPHHV